MRLWSWGVRGVEVITCARITANRRMGGGFVTGVNRMAGQYG
ncbi:hypothetical protein LHK_01452 [Laribacter hongkongensis HLHK9]|uniref:Uncharacterized protein n=1 Tax=Laribacter hongkongensis (strain HLHK9) TaxID=557598 RepID=C1D7K2_LARHH|nr:hypothetical protein LHK_01452 [Laribacter hongkongensis HLHK9]